MGLTAIACALGCADDPQAPGASESTAETTGSTSAGSTSSDPSVTDASSSAGSTTSGSSSGPGPGTTTTGAPPIELCNGEAVLCDRPYDQIVFPGAHNANSARAWGYAELNANHQSGMDVMLEAGLRVLLIDVHEFEGETTMCHGPCGLGNTPHIEGLELIRGFLESNPHDVLTIIYQDEVSVDAMVADFELAELTDVVFTHEPGAPWPTLREMIEADTRLVVTAENGRPPPGWYHHVWDVASDTPFTFFSLEEMSCELNRGGAENDLFLMNHWVNTKANLPSEDNAISSNAPQQIVERARQCERERGQLPTFIAVDFFEQGDVVAATRELNGLL